MDFNSKLFIGNGFSDINISESPSEFIENSSSELLLNFEEHRNKNKTIEEFNTLLKGLTFTNESFEIICISNEKDFSKYRAIILNNYYIVIDYKDNMLNVITENKKVFVINTLTLNQSVYNILFKVNLPRKICFDFSSIFNLYPNIQTSVYDIRLVFNMFYQASSSELVDFVQLFSRNELSDITYYQLLFDLFLIKDKFNEIIEKNRLFSLVNAEFETSKLVHHIELIGLPFSKDNYTEQVNIISNVYASALDSFRDKYHEDFIDLETLLKSYNKYNIAPILNLNYLEEINYEFLGVIKAKKILDNLSSFSHSHTDDRLFIKYNPYNFHGDIESVTPVDNFYILSTKNIITGTFKDIYFRIFASLSNIDYLIDSINRNDFEVFLTKKIVGDYSIEYKYYVLALLRAIINRYFDLDVLRNYLFVEEYIYMNKNDLTSLFKMFEDNCPEILNFVSGFNRYKSKGKRYILDPNELLHNYIKTTIADIYKHSILLINSSIIEYNKKSQSKLHIVGLFENKIIIESDDSSVNVAIDILNRHLISSFNKYIDKVQIICNVFSSNKLK